MEQTNDHRIPPRIAGDIAIARFPDASGKWRVSLSGHTHFLTDAETAQRIRALAIPPSGKLDYGMAYASYRRDAGATPQSFDGFVQWCEMHRARLEQLSSTPDGHPLRFRRLLLDQHACARIATPLGVLFNRVCMGLAWSAALLLVARYLAHPQSTVGAGFWPAAAITLLGVLVHEFGHVAACIRFGARQGGIGFGVYWIWPAFYADVRGSWVLDHRRRAVVSLGGLYFQSIYLALLIVATLATANATLALAIGMTLLLMATTLNPVFKFDGYWILSDLLNVTNLHTRIASHLRALVNARADAAWRLLRRPMTALCAGFALVAIAYVGYVFYVMAIAGGRTAMRLPALWSDVAALATSGWAVDQLASVATAAVSIVLQLALVGMATVFLGIRSVQSLVRLLPDGAKHP